MMWAALILAIVLLLCKFPKITLKIVGLILLFSVFSIGLILLFSFYSHRKESLLEKQITIVVDYFPNENGCPNDYPLKILINNHSERFVKEIDYLIRIYVKGYSKNVSDYQTYSSYQVIPPKESISLCQKMPALDLRDIPVNLTTISDYRNQLIFVGKSEFIRFYDKNEKIPYAYKLSLADISDEQLLKLAYERGIKVRSKA